MFKMRPLCLKMRPLSLLNEKKTGHESPASLLGKTDD